MSSYRDIEMKVIEWGQARSIISNSTPQGQARKSAEEVTELVEAATKLRVISDLIHEVPELRDDPRVLAYRQKALAELKDAHADIIITLILGAAIADVDLIDCLEGGYNEIKDRRGHLNKAGIFVKEA